MCFPALSQEKTPHNRGTDAREGDPDWEGGICHRGRELTGVSALLLSLSGLPGSSRGSHGRARPAAPAAPSLQREERGFWG